MSFIKALIPGLLLTLVVATLLGSNGSTGAFLNIHQETLGGHDFYWSWPLFIASTGLAWGIFWMMD
jgi:hypothetical protein